MTALPTTVWWFSPVRCQGAPASRNPQSRLWWLRRRTEICPNRGATDTRIRGQRAAGHTWQDEMPGRPLPGTAGQARGPKCRRAGGVIAGSGAGGSRRKAADRHAENNAADMLPRSLSSGQAHPLRDTANRIGDGSGSPRPLSRRRSRAPRRFASVSHLLRLRAAVRLGLGKDRLLSHRHGRPGFEATFAVD